jgi:hypothetical protein
MKNLSSKIRVILFVVVLVVFVLAASAPSITGPVGG